MKIEVCCGSYSDALAAYVGGANRVELCSNLFFGGLTPSLGSFLMTKKNTNLEIAVMLRPREGGFCYSKYDLELLIEDGKIFIEHGADAIVFGCLNNDKTIDYESCKKVCDMVDGRCDIVFHRAFDISTTPIDEAVIGLREIGVNRILTSGREKTALEGADNIKKMIDIGGIQILPAGSIRIHNLNDLWQKTGCTYIHTSAFESHIDPSAIHKNIFFTGLTAPRQGEYSLANSDIVKNIVQFGRNLGENINL